GAGDGLGFLGQPWEGTMTEAMTEPKAGDVPWHLWVVGIIALLWNGFGAYDYLMTQIGGVGYLTSMGMTQPQIDYFLAMPAWMSAVWAIGVWGALLGSILLLLRLRWAVWAFAASLAAVAVSIVYAYLLSNGAEVMGTGPAIMNFVIFIAAIGFLVYAARMKKAGVLR